MKSTVRGDEFFGAKDRRTPLPSFPPPPPRKRLRAPLSLQIAGTVASVPAHHPVRQMVPSVIISGSQPDPTCLLAFAFAAGIITVPSLSPSPSPSPSLSLHCSLALSLTSCFSLLSLSRSHRTLPLPLSAAALSHTTYAQQGLGTMGPKRSYTTGPRSLQSPRSSR